MRVYGLLVILILFIYCICLNSYSEQINSPDTQGHVTPDLLNSDQPVHFDIVSDGSMVEFEGKSFMHHFEGTSHSVTGFTKGPFNSAVLTGCEITIPIESIEGKALGKSRDDLTRNIHENLEYDKYPNIEFKLIRAEPYRNVDLNSGTGDYMIEGDLTIHNQTRRILFPVNMEIKNGYLHFTGRYDQLNVRDFGVEPKPLMAFIKVGDKVDVKFDIYEDVTSGKESPEQSAKSTE